MSKRKQLIREIPKEDWIESSEKVPWGQLLEDIIASILLCLLVLSPEGQPCGVHSLTFSETGPQDQPAGQWHPGSSPSQWHLDASEQTATRCGKRRSPGERCGGQRPSPSTCGGLGGPWTTRRCRSAERMQTLSKETMHLALPWKHLNLPLPHSSPSSPLTSTLLLSSASSSIPGVFLGWFP